MLDTAYRPGEIMSLQWREVNLQRRELTIRAEKEGNMLGHANLSTTSRYLNINRRGLQLAMEEFEENRAEWTSRQAKSESVAQPLHTADEPPQAVVQRPTAKPTLQ